MSNNDALVALDALLALPQVSVLEESLGVFGLWRALAATDTASHNVWMDAYFANRANVLRNLATLGAATAMQ